MASAEFRLWASDDSPPINTALSKSLRVGFKNGELRSVYWRVLLGQLSAPSTLPKKVARGFSKDEVPVAPLSAASAVGNKKKPKTRIVQKTIRRRKPHHVSKASSAGRVALKPLVASDSSDSDEEQNVPRRPPPKTKPSAKPRAQFSSDDSSSGDDAGGAAADPLSAPLGDKKKQAAPPPPKKKAPAIDSSPSDDSSSEEDVVEEVEEPITSSEEEAEEPIAVASPTAEAPAIKKDDDQSSTSSLDEDDLFELQQDRWQLDCNRTRKKYTEWRETRHGTKKPAASNSASVSPLQPKTPASSPAPASAKKKAPAGPRFNDDSSSSSSSSDDDAGADADGRSGGAAVVALNPLATAPEADKHWGAYFEQQKAMELVDKDLARLSLGYEDFFEDEDRRAELREVLQALLECKVVPDYCQGMHELIAIFAWVLWEDAEAVERMPASDSAKPMLQLVCNKAHLKHDTFAMMGALMQDLNMNEWFEADTSPPPPAVRGKRSAKQDNSPLFRLITHLQTKQLAVLMPDLANHLTNTLDIPPVVYGIRWLRLLFLREFTLSQATRLWDAVIAEHHVTQKELGDDSLAVHFALTMLLYIGKDLLEKDYNDALRRFMRYPPVEDIGVIIEASVRRAYGAESEMGQLAGLEPEPEPVVQQAPPPAEAKKEEAADALQPEPSSFVVVDMPPKREDHHQDPNGVGASSSSASATAAAAAARSALRPEAGSTLRPVSATESVLASLSQAWSARQSEAAVTTPTSASPGSTRADQMIQQQQRLGRRLDDVVAKLNNKWFPNAGQSAEDLESEYILAIAELKRIRDVLLHGVDE